jgi:hypothetical protein
MGDAWRTLEPLREYPFEIPNSALALGDLQFVGSDDRDPSGVVAPIFEPVEPFHQDRCCVAPPNVTDDPAHPLSPQP